MLDREVEVVLTDVEGNFGGNHRVAEIPKTHEYRLYWYPTTIMFDGFESPDKLPPRESASIPYIEPDVVRPSNKADTAGGV